MVYLFNGYVVDEDVIDNYIAEIDSYFDNVTDDECYI